MNGLDNLLICVLTSINKQLLPLISVDHLSIFKSVLEMKHTAHDPNKVSCLLQMLAPSNTICWLNHQIFQHPLVLIVVPKECSSGDLHNNSWVNPKYWLTSHVSFVKRQKDLLVVFSLCFSQIPSNPQDLRVTSTFYTPILTHRGSTHSIDSSNLTVHRTSSHMKERIGDIGTSHAFINGQSYFPRSFANHAIEWFMLTIRIGFLLMMLNHPLK